MDKMQLYNEYKEHIGMCIYCQKQFRSPRTWEKHVSTKHPGVWASIEARYGKEKAKKA